MPEKIETWDEPDDRTVLNRNQVREVDRLAMEQIGISGVVLMENAGRGCVDRLQAAGIGHGVSVCCGVGNNAGDGFVIARHLAIRGFRVQAILFSSPEKLKGDAAINFQILEKSHVPIVILDKKTATDPSDADGTTDSALLDQLESLVSRGGDWVVDALLGTGATGPLRRPLDAVVPLLNRLPKRRMSVDVPTGLDCDSGETESPAFRAELTCTFVAVKPGMLTEEGREVCGRIEVLDIGAPRELITQVQNGA